MAWMHFTMVAGLNLTASHIPIAAAVFPPWGRHELLVEPSTALAHPTVAWLELLYHPEHKSHPLLGHDDAAEAQPAFAGSVMADEQAESL